MFFEIFFVIRQFSLPTRDDLEFDFFQSDRFVSKGVLTRSKVDVFRFSTPKTHQKAMQIQPGGQETGPTNRGHLRRTENQLIYDSFHPLRPPCGGAELLAGLWGRTLRCANLRKPMISPVWRCRLGELLGPWVRKLGYDKGH